MKTITRSEVEKAERELSAICGYAESGPDFDERVNARMERVRQSQAARDAKRRSKQDRSFLASYLRNKHS